jgi:hypothetical protein
MHLAQEKNIISVHKVQGFAGFIIVEHNKYMHVAYTNSKTKKSKKSCEIDVGVVHMDVLQEYMPGISKLIRF